MMKKIAIFGATGMTGLCTLEAALKQGLEVSTLLRDPQKLPSEYHSKVNIIQGDVLHLADVKKAIEGKDGVVVALGTRNDLSPTTVMSEGMKNIVTAMKEANVSVVSVCLSAFLFYEPTKVPPMFHNINDDHLRMYNVLKESGLNYIAVWPPHIAADAPPSEYKIEYDKSPGRQISKHDLGSFLVEALSKPEHYKKVIGIANVVKA
uniref:Flavin reductase (NADPH) n=1 Tax=Cacopsylla melanoneura TaxID=428564 RepID=A0A8D8LRA2_9HEMI